MRTPFGQECKFFYGDYFRGKKFEECRLVSEDPESGQWNVEICRKCPVPGILLANGCEFMKLHGVIKKGVFGKKKITIQAFCEKSQKVVVEPKVGCEICHSANWRLPMHE
jgi:hypothetical protein